VGKGGISHCYPVREKTSLEKYITLMPNNIQKSLLAVDLTEFLKL
jgi:hypothetical protein